MMRRVQLPNGDWVCPEEVAALSCVTIPHPRVRAVKTAVLVVLRGGREIQVDTPEYTNVRQSEELRDQIAQLIGWSGSIEEDGGPPPGYEAVCQELKARILALIPGHPEILELGSVWDLFKVPGFACDDLGPSMAQAGAALAAARAEYRRRSAAAEGTG